MFKDTIETLHRGDLVPQLDEALTKLVTAVQETGKKGAVTLKISVQPATKGTDVEQVVVSAEVAEKLPKPSRAPSLFFTDRSGKLMREDPKQTKLELREIERPAAPLRSVNAGE